MKLMNDHMSAKDAKDKVKKLNSPQVIFVLTIRPKFLKLKFLFF